MRTCCPHHSSFKMSLSCAQHNSQNRDGIEKGEKRKRVNLTWYPIANLLFRHMETKCVNKDYFLNITILFVASKKFVPSSDVTHHLLARDAWLVSYRLDMAEELEGEERRHELPWLFACAQQQQHVLPCPFRRHFALPRGEAQEQQVWSTKLTESNFRASQPTCPFSPQSYCPTWFIWTGKVLMSFSSQVLLLCSLHCCAPPHRPVVCLPDPFWKAIHARDTQ